MNTQTQLPPAPPAPSSRKLGRRERRFWSRIRLIGLALLALLIGIAIGYSATPTDELESDLSAARADLAEAQDAADRSQELLELATDESSDARAERDAALADLAGAEQTIKELQRRVRGLQGQNKRLEEKANKAAPGARETMGDGTWRVSEEVVPGTYRAPGGGNCYWERLSNFSGDLGGIIANGFADRNPTVTIASSDAGFSTDGCGTWTKIG